MIRHDGKIHVADFKTLCGIYNRSILPAYFHQKTIIKDCANNLINFGVSRYTRNTRYIQEARYVQVFTFVKQSFHQYKNNDIIINTVHYCISTYSIILYIPYSIIFDHHHYNFGERWHYILIFYKKYLLYFVYSTLFASVSHMFAPQFSRIFYTTI